MTAGTAPWGALGRQIAAVWGIGVLRALKGGDFSGFERREDILDILHWFAFIWVYLVDVGKYG